MKSLVRPSFLIVLFGFVALIFTAQAAEKIGGAFRSGNDSDLEKAVSNRISSQKNVDMKPSVSLKLSPDAEAKVDELFDSLVSDKNQSAASGAMQKSLEAVKRKVQEIVPSPLTSRQSTPPDAMAELGLDK